jgi:hypothetical protein
MSFLFLGVAASGFIAGSLAVLPYHCLRMARLRRENASRLRRINRIWQLRVAYCWRSGPSANTSLRTQPGRSSR